MSQGRCAVSQRLLSSSRPRQQEAEDIKTDEHTNALFSMTLNRESKADTSRQPITIADVKITDSDVAYFRGKGYCMPDQPFLDAATCATLRHEFQRIFSGALDFDAVPPEFEYWAKVVQEHTADSPAVRKVNNSWWINAAMRDLATSPSLGRAAGALLGTNEVRLWHDQAILKPGGDPLRGDNDLSAGNIGWHQDYGFWRASSSTQMVTAFVALQDMDLGNGCMRTITGSHRWGLIDNSNMFFDTDLTKQEDNFRNAAAAKGVEDDWEDLPTVMKEGQVAFHHCLTFHGSGANSSPTPRMAAAIHMQGGAVRYKAGQWHPNVRELGPGAKDGQRFTGEAFPLMWEA